MHKPIIRVCHEPRFLINPFQKRKGNFEILIFLIQK